MSNAQSLTVSRFSLVERRGMDHMTMCSGVHRT
jgi:hypothetical protein